MKHKKTLLIMVIVSLIVSIYRVYDLFLKPIKQIKIILTGDQEIDRMLKESQLFEHQLQVFQENLPNKIFIILLLLLVLIAIFFYFKKYFLYTYASYLGYVGVNLLRVGYHYYNMQNLMSRITIKEAHQFVDLGSKFTLYGSIITSTLYILLLLYGVLAIYRAKQVKISVS